MEKEEIDAVIHEFSGHGCSSITIDSSMLNTFVVSLHEPIDLRVTLSIKGYTVVSKTSRNTESLSEQSMKHLVGQTFETMQALLDTASPAFRQFFANSLMSRLSAL